MRRWATILVCMTAVAAAGDDGADATSHPADTPRSVDAVRRATVAAPRQQEQESSRSLAEAIRRLQAIQVPADRPDDVETTKRPTTAPATMPATAPADQPPATAAEDMRDLVARDADAAREVGDALYRAGRYRDAEVLYAAALDRCEKDGERAWMLYQVANCRLHADAASAADCYQRVTSEHPDSPWAAQARAQKRVLDWRRANGIEELVESVRNANGSGEVR